MNQAEFKTTTKIFNFEKETHYAVWIFENGSVTKISNDQFKAAFKINNNSQVLGCQFTEISEKVGSVTYSTKKTEVKTAIYDLNDQSVRVLQFPSDSLGADINDKGQVAGVFYNQIEKTMQGFLGDPAVDLIVIEELNPKALNNNGQIIGTFLHGEKKGKPAFWDNGVLLDIADITDFVDDQGNTWESIDRIEEINDHGMIVGSGKYKGKVHGLLLKPLL